MLNTLIGADGKKLKRAIEEENEVFKEIYFMEISKTRISVR